MRGESRVGARGPSFTLGRAIPLMAWVLLVGCGGESSGTLLGSGGGGVAASHATEQGRMPAELASSAAARAAVQRDAPASYDFRLSTTGGRALADNQAHGVQVSLAAGAVRLFAGFGPSAVPLEVRWTRLGRGDDLESVPEASDAMDLTGNRATWLRGPALEEWYLNGPLGLEQGFVIQERPSRSPGMGSAEAVTIELTIEGQTHAWIDEARGVVELRGRAGRPIRYSELHAEDASGRVLPSWLDLSGSAILLRIDDSNAHYPLYVDPFFTTPQEKLLAADGAAEDYFGQTVAVAHDVVLVGAYRDDDAGDSSGSAYVFVRGASAWSQEAKLVAANPSAAAYFGSSVALELDTALVGAYRESSAGANAGAAYVFTRGGAGWSQSQKLTASDASVDDLFGSAAALALPRFRRQLRYAA